MPMHSDGTPAAFLTVDGSESCLRDGEFHLWDDTFEHSVEWKRQASSRVAARHQAAGYALRPRGTIERLHV